MNTLRFAILLANGLIFSLAFALPVSIDPNGVVLSNPQAICSLSINPDQNADGIATISSYTIGDSISFISTSDCHLYLYLFNIGADNSVNFIPGPSGAMSPQAYLSAGSILSLPSNGGHYSITGPVGYDRIVAIGSRISLNPNQISQFSSAMQYGLRSGQPVSLAEIEVIGLAAQDWVSAYTSYLVGQVPNVPVAVATVTTTTISTQSLDATTVATIPCIFYTLPETVISLSDRSFTVINGEITYHLIPGSYNITVSKPGYTTITKTIMVYGNQQNTFDFQLEPLATN